jgi:hypothetical protein
VLSKLYVGYTQFPEWEVKLMVGSNDIVQEVELVVSDQVGTLIAAVVFAPKITQDWEPSDSEYVEYVQSEEIEASVYVEYVQSEEIEVSVYVSCMQSLELVVSDQVGTLIAAVVFAPKITQDWEPSDSEYVEYVQSEEIEASVYVEYAQSEEIEASVYVSYTQVPEVA